MTGETMERISALDAAPLYWCTECHGVSRTRMPNHDPDCPVIA